MAYAVGTATIAPAEAGRDGGALRIFKGIGVGTEFGFHIAAPIRPGQGFGTRFRYRVAGPGPVGPLWFQIFYARHIATDASGEASQRVAGVDGAGFRQQGGWSPRPHPP